MKFAIYAILVTALSTGVSWSKFFNVVRASDWTSTSSSSGRSGWSSNTGSGGGSWSGGSSGSHK